MEVIKSNAPAINTGRNPRPTTGQTVPFQGGIATIVKVHPFGTIDVETAEGNHYRITGLPFV